MRKLFTLFMLAIGLVGLGGTPAMAASAPGAPTGVGAFAGNGTATAYFSPPTSNGGSTITSYRATAYNSSGSTVATADGSASPISISGLPLGSNYTVKVKARNAIGWGASSAPLPYTVKTSSALPSSKLDLARWKITLPVGVDKAAEVKHPVLNNFIAHPWFYVNDTDTGVVFRANVEGVTTSGSTYPRSELREMNPDGTKASWSSTSGTHKMSLTGSIDHTPTVRPRVVIAQIHDASDDIIEVLADMNASGGPAIVWRYLSATQSTKLIQPYTLGTPFDLRIEASGGQMRIYVGGVQKASVAHSGSGLYFKAGCYTQSNELSDAVGAYGQTTLRALSITHL